MARVQYKSTPGGIIVRRNGDAREGVTITHAGTAPFADATSATLYEGPLTTNIDGEVPGWLDPGIYTTTDPSTGKSVTFEVGASTRVEFNIMDYGAFGDGGTHPLSSVYATLAAAQAVYPTATALTQEIDGQALRKALAAAAQAKANYNATGYYQGVVRLPQGQYQFDGGITIPQDVSIEGVRGGHRSVLQCVDVGASTVAAITSTAGSTGRNVPLRDVRLLGNAALVNAVSPTPPTARSGIHCAENCRVEGCFIDGWRYGITMRENHEQVVDCNITANWAGIAFVNGGNTTEADQYFAELDLTGNVWTGLYCEGERRISGATFVRCHFGSGALYCFYKTAGTNTNFLTFCLMVYCGFETFRNGIAHMSDGSGTINNVEMIHCTSSGAFNAPNVTYNYNGAIRCNTVTNLRVTGDRNFPALPAGATCVIDALTVASCELGDQEPTILAGKSVIAVGASVSRTYSTGVSGARVRYVDFSPYRQAMNDIHAPLMASGQWYGPPGAVTTVNRPNAFITYGRLAVPEVTVDRIGVEITGAGSAGALLRLGIYADDGGKPGALLLDAGTVDGTLTGVQSISISKTLDAQVVWLAVAVQGAPVTTPTVRGITSASIPGVPLVATNFAVGAGWTQNSGGGGALPNPAAPAQGAADNLLLCAVRAA